jgi:predicted RNase H-like HicB family nuclease
MARRVIFRAEFFREGDLYVGLVPELDVSSFGESLNEAKVSLKEAVEAFLEECEAMGTLEEVLQEAGFSQDGDCWSARSPLAMEMLSVS